MKLDWKNERHRAWIIFALSLLFPIAFSEFCSAIWPPPPFSGTMFDSKGGVPQPFWANPFFGVLPGLIAFWWLPMKPGEVWKPLVVIVISLLYAAVFAPQFLFSVIIFLGALLHGHAGL